MQSRAARPTKQAGPSSQKSEQNQWQGPSNVTTFIRCLRLLDLDRLPDWPGITEKVFTSKVAQQNLQTRVKAVEWSLYRLLEIYDPKETQTKLRPFFPPLAPLQSLNLRAALYRALTDLKKNGVFGRDIVLRKTMLDECKGDKFEEVVSTLALLVLKKVYPSRHPDLSLKHIRGLSKEHLVFIILAHRNSLHQSLRKRQAISEQADKYAEWLALEEANLQQRKHEADQGFQPVDENDLAQFSIIIKNKWIGDERWSDVLLEGPKPSDRSLSYSSFEESWAKSPDSRTISESKTNPLVSELDERIAAQEKRLKKWKTYHFSLENAQLSKQQILQPQKPSGSHFSLRFDRHKDLRLKPQHPQDPATEQLEPYHASILRNMQNELANLDASHNTLIDLPLQEVSAKPFLLATKSCTTPELMAHQDSKVLQSVASTSGSSLEDSRGLTDVTSATRSIHTLGTDTDLELMTDETKAALRVRVADVARSTSIDPNGRDEDVTSIPSSPPVGCVTSHDISQDPVVRVEDDNLPVTSQPKKQESNGTLLERTRASLLPFLRVHEAIPSEPQAEFSPDSDDDGIQSLPPLPDVTARPGTLLERTRQSMSLLPTPASKSNKQPRFSEIFPVNQFETPRTSHAQQRGGWSPRPDSSTPRDRLFSEEADYASVFKSRPRVALSPSLSPERSNLSLDSMLVDGVEGLNLEDEEDTPSRGLVRHAR